MKYQSIDIEYYRYLKELKEFEHMKSLMFKGLKYGYYLFIIIILFNAFFAGNLVLAQSSNIEFEFETAYAYNGVLPDSTILGNQRFLSEPTGHFPATYSFENETGLEGLDISFQSYNDSIDEAIVIGSYLNHSEVLRIYDASTGSFYHSFEGQINGTVEFWIDLYSGTAIEFYFIENSTGFHAIDSRIYADTTRNYKGDGIGGSEYTNLAVDEGWIHFKIEWNCVADTFDLFINEYQLYDDVNFLADQDLSVIDKFRFKISTAGSYGVLDAYGESWECGINEYELLNVDLNFGSFSGNLDDANIDDSNYFTITSEDYVGQESILAYFIFNKSYPMSYAYLSYNISSTVDLDFYDDSIFDTGLSLDDDYVELSDPLSELFILSLHIGNSYTCLVYYIRLFIYQPYYIIGMNLISTTVLSNNTEVDKFEFTFDSTGNMNQNGDDDVSGFTDIENDFWNDDVVNVYDSIDDAVDKCVRILGGQKGNVGIQRDFDVGVDTIEVSWQFDLINLGYPINQIYTKIQNGDSDTIALFKLEGEYIPIGASRFANLSYYYDSNWVLLQTGIAVYNNFNMTFVLNWTNGDNSGVLGFEGNNYDILFENDQDSIGYFLIYGINDHNIVWGNLNLEIDWIRIIVNDSSLSDEVMPDNIFILTGNDFSLLYQSFIEITFDITYDNNISIFLNDDIEIIPYVYNASAERVFFRNFYQAKSYTGLFFKIYNSTSYNIENIKVYGIRMVNQQDSNDNPFLEFDYSYVNPNESYFYVSGNDLHYYFESDNNTALEYIQATFNIVDLSCEGYSIGFSHQKGTTYLQSECKVVFTSDTYISFLSYDTSQFVSVILPQERIIKEIIFLVTDDDKQIVDTSEGYFSDLLFMYYSDIGITITTLSLLDMIPIVVLVVIIPMALYIGFGKRKEILVPSIMGMSIFGTVIGIIPLWLTAVITFACVCYYLIRRFGSE